MERRGTARALTPAAASWLRRWFAQQSTHYSATEEQQDHIPAAIEWKLRFSTPQKKPRAAAGRNDRS
jgi:hypothetical protein